MKQRPVRHMTSDAETLLINAQVVERSEVKVKSMLEETIEMCFNRKLNT
jgi:hypothetical protein